MPDNYICKLGSIAWETLPYMLPSRLIFTEQAPSVWELTDFEAILTSTIVEVNVFSFSVLTNYTHIITLAELPVSIRVEVWIWLTIIGTVALDSAGWMTGNCFLSAVELEAQDALVEFLSDPIFDELWHTLK